MKSLKEIVEQLKSCGYTCEAGPLENNVDFRLLAGLAGVEVSKTFPESFQDLRKAFMKLGGLKSPQQQRDEIIEKAKRDVTELETYMQQGGYRNFETKSKYVVNSRVVIALVSIDTPKRFLNNGLLAKGIAKADPSDCFNVHIGKAIALRRALGLEVPAEYLLVPQPTEVRVGDVVKGVYADGSSTYVETVSYVSDSKIIRYKSGGYDLIARLNLKVIDDSREEVAE